MGRSCDSDTDFFEIVVVVLKRDTLVSFVLKGDTLEPVLLIICQNYIQKMSIYLRKNGFILKEVKNRRYPVEIITDIDYADDLVLLVSTSVQAESRQHSKDKVSLVST